MLPLNLELRQVYSAHQLAQFGAPQGLTRLIILETFSKLIVEAGGYQQCNDRILNYRVFMLALKIYIYIHIHNST